MRSILFVANSFDRDRTRKITVVTAVRCGKFGKNGIDAILHLCRMDGSFQPCGKERAFQIAAKALTPLTKKIFKTSNPAALESLAMNMSCNLLGIGGAATPYAVKAIAELEKDKNDWAQKLLFVINATSVQLLPTTVITLRASAGSASAFDIFLPSLICTSISTALAVALYTFGRRIWR